MTLLYEEYSPWKGVHFLDRLNIVKSGGVCSPVSLQLGLTNKCSNKCYYCYVKEQNNLGETLKTDAVVNLLEEAKMMGVKSVEITGGGEPTLHPDFWDIVDKIRDLDLELGLVTNGLHLKSDKIHKLDFVSWVRISIDSYNPTIYKEIRGANLLNLEPIMKLCKETNVIVGASCVITPKNYQEIYEFAKMSKDLGFSHVWFKPVEMSDNPTILNQYLDVCEENIKKASMLADSNFKVFSPNLKAEVQGIMKPFLKCICQYLSPFVWANGDIYPCCSLQGYSETSFGNIYKGSFADQWYSHNPLAVKDCPINCFWVNKNTFMNYILLDNPKHVNFV